MASMICYSLLTTLKVNGRRFRHLLSWKKSASYAWLKNFLLKKNVKYQAHQMEYGQFVFRT